MAPRRRRTLGFDDHERLMIRLTAPVGPDAWVTDPSRGGFRDFDGRWRLYGAEVLREAADDEHRGDNLVAQLIAAYGCPDGWP